MRAMSAQTGANPLTVAKAYRYFTEFGIMSVRRGRGLCPKTAVIELARLLSDLRGKSVLRIRLVLFVNEEPPYFKSDAMGSFVYAGK